VKRRGLPSIAAGVAVSLSLWLSDLARLSGHPFAGVTDSGAAARVLAVAREALFSLELRLFLLHLALGALAGLLFALAWHSALSPARSRLRELFASAGFTFSLFALALLAMAARYPQLYSDRWWLSGGAPALLEHFVTHRIGPLWLDGGFLALAVSASAVAALGSARRVVQVAKGFALRKSVVTASVLAAAVIALRAGSRPLRATDRPKTPNLLILASDSLRTDRVENEEVMPFTASRIGKGSLYRYAFTPIARTYPSWVSTLTGTEPRTNGVRHMFPTLENRRDVGPTLFTELRDRDYFTFAVSDFAGDIFSGFEGGFESLDVPHLTVDTLAQSTTLTGHTWSLPLLRIAWVRRLLPYWRNVPSLADPEWVADGVIRQIEGSGGRPFAGLVFFSTAHFPYVAPYPDYLEGSGEYKGRYLYQVPPVQPDEAPGPDDVAQIRARYDGALRSIDRAMERIDGVLRSRGLDRNTLLVITGDHGEELYEEEGIAGHGDTLSHPRSQAVPIFLEGPGVPRGVKSSAQVRLYDLPATILPLLEPGASRVFGEGESLFDDDAERPICLETGIWFWPSRPLGLAGRRLQYPAISELLELEPRTREMVLRADMESLVESAKERALALGDRMYREQMTPKGLEREVVSLPGIEPPPSKGGIEAAGIERLFEERCVEQDPNLRRLYGVVVFDRGAKKER
jgi:arylsulfatase A-like enzyme